VVQLSPSGGTGPAIRAVGLGKTYVVPEREGGVRAALSAVVRRRTREVRAVSDVGFEIAAGEIVGFLGPNGAGKTTTLKMLAGLLVPSAGTADVLGFVPWRRDHRYLARMALVMGQRNQLQWDIPVLDSYRLFQAIFRIPAADFTARLAELSELLELDELLRKPVRNLSLGERMKCEIAGSLLHAPSVLFLDEPTIGLDVAMQRRIRSFVAEYNRRTGACVMLTSHYMADVQALCRRVIVIHQGRLLFDGDLAGLVQRFAAYKTISVELEEGAAVSEAAVSDLVGGATVVRSAVGLTVRVPKAATAAVAGRLLAALPVADLTVEEPPIEQVIEDVFAGSGSFPGTGDD
jgi:ABC-2 type transport system ATP-binding protein